MSDDTTRQTAVADQGGETGPPESRHDSSAREQQERDLLRIWATPRGWRYWSAVNNSEVGKWYGITAFAFFLFAGVLALIIRAQLSVPGNELVSPDTYNQLMTLHGSVMMFLFAVPMLEAVAILLLPAMLATRDLPFPRLSAFGFWAFLIGGVFVCGSIFFDSAPDGGWFMYPPLTTDTSQSGIGADIWLLGLSFIEVASIAAAVELIVGVLKCRPPGMRLHLMPPYAWYVLVVGVMILFAFPPLIAGDLLFEFERAFDWPFFDAARGGDPVLWQHLFWIFGHPEVYIIFLPSIAILAMVIPTFCRVPLFGYSWVVLAAVTTGFLSFGLWVHHMFTVGLPGLSIGFFSAASEAVAIPTAIQIFALLGTVMVGQYTRSVPMLFAAGALAIFVLGGLTGVMVAIAPFNWQAHDTYFIVAHLHYVLFGGMVFPLFAGVYYWYPKATGRLLSEQAGRLAFWLMFAGFNIAFAPMHLTGLMGMPRRVVTYDTALGVDWLNLISSVGAFVLAAGIVIVAVDAFRPHRFKAQAGRNPWRAGTLDWLDELPGKPFGMRSVPRVSTRYPLWEEPGLEDGILQGKGYLADAPTGQRESLITSVIDAEPIQCLRLASTAWITLLTAASLGGAFIFATFHLIWPALGCALLTLGCVLYWLWTGTGAIPEKAERDVGNGLTLPVYVSGPRSVGWWGMFITMTGDMTAFVSLVFAYFYYWTIHPLFPGPDAIQPSGWLLATGSVAVAAAWWLTLRARRDNGNRQERAARIRLALAAGSTFAAIAAFAASVLASGMDPTRHVYEAIVAMLVLWTVAHLGVGAIMQLFCLAASVRHRMDPVHDTDIQNVMLFWHFAAVTVAITMLIIGVAPFTQ